MGKTSLATNIAFNAAQRWIARHGRRHRARGKSIGAPVAFFSLEMSADQLATRILAEHSGVVSEKFRIGQDQPCRIPDQFARAAADLENLPLFIDDTPA